MRLLMLPATASATSVIVVAPAAAAIVVTATADTAVVVALSTHDVVVPYQSKFVFFMRTCHVCRTHINIILNTAPHTAP